ncbi:37027_t:CDS:1 [Racocetra persica]|uniref:37027_t:CDS:1 n=1 Tax=Racocetra persica TaxID=160502 RepID=A0ACA9LX13_9GLOM|nr:37027_t:CDS:1 [Racocetra persica]
MSHQNKFIGGSFDLSQSGRPSQQEWLFIDESSTIASPKPKRPCDLSNLLVIVPFPPKVDPSDLIRRNKHGELLARSTNKFLIYRNEYAKQLHSQGYRLSMREVSKMASKAWKKEERRVKRKYEEIAREVERIHVRLAMSDNSKQELKNKNKLNGDHVAKQTTNEHEKMQQQFYDKIRLKQETQTGMDVSPSDPCSVFRESDDDSVTSDTLSQQIELIEPIIPSQRYDASPILSPIMHFTDAQERQPTYFLEQEANNNQLYQLYNNDPISFSQLNNTLTPSQIDNIINFSLSSADYFFHSTACNNFSTNSAVDRNLGANPIIVNFGNSIGNGSPMSFL